MHKVLVNRLGGLSLPRKSVVRLTDRPDMTIDVHRGRKTTMQQQQQKSFLSVTTELLCLCVYDCFEQCGNLNDWPFCCLVLSCFVI